MLEWTGYLNRVARWPGGSPTTETPEHPANYRRKPLRHSTVAKSSQAVETRFAGAQGWCTGWRAGMACAAGALTALWCWKLK